MQLHVKMRWLLLAFIYLIVIAESIFTFKQSSNGINFHPLTIPPKCSSPGNCSVQLDETTSFLSIKTDLLGVENCFVDGKQIDCSSLRKIAMPSKQQRHIMINSNKSNYSVVATRPSKSDASIRGVQLLSGELPPFRDGFGASMLLNGVQKLDNDIVHLLIKMSGSKQTLSVTLNNRINIDLPSNSKNPLTKITSTSTEAQIMNQVSPTVPCILQQEDDPLTFYCKFALDIKRSADLSVSVASANGKSETNFDIHIKRPGCKSEELAIPDSSGKIVCKAIGDESCPIHAQAFDPVVGRCSECPPGCAKCSKVGVCDACNKDLTCRASDGPFNGRTTSAVALFTKPTLINGRCVCASLHPVYIVTKAICSVLLMIGVIGGFALLCRNIYKTRYNDNFDAFQKESKSIYISLVERVPILSEYILNKPKIQSIHAAQNLDDFQTSSNGPLLSFPSPLPDPFISTAAEEAVMTFFATGRQVKRLSFDAPALAPSKPEKPNIGQKNQKKPQSPKKGGRGNSPTKKSNNTSTSRNATSDDIRRFTVKAPPLKNQINKNQQEPTNSKSPSKGKLNNTPSRHLSPKTKQKSPPVEQRNSPTCRAPQTPYMPFSSFNDAPNSNIESPAMKWFNNLLR